MLNLRPMIERAVINAGPLVALSLLGELELLSTLFSEVWIPQTVALLCSNPRKAWASRGARRLRVVPIRRC
jgi:predicted nucleic acid-binding protein